MSPPSLGRPVRLSGVELRLLPRPAFLLTNLTVEEDPAYGSEPVLHADTVVADIRFASLWRGRLQISRISVDDASLNLVRAGDGRWNIDSLFRNAAAGSHQGRAVPHPYLEATNSRINIKNGMEKLPFSLLDADAALWQESDGEWRVRLEGQPARTDVSLDLADTGIVRLDGTLRPAPQFSQMPLHLDAEWRNAQFGQLSRLLLGSDEGWRGDLRGELHLDGTAASAHVQASLRATGVHREEFAPVAPLDFDASCTFVLHYDSRSVDGVDCNSPVGDGHARLTGSISQRGSQCDSRWTWTASPPRLAWTCCAPSAATWMPASRQPAPSAAIWLTIPAQPFRATIPQSRRPRRRTPCSPRTAYRQPDTGWP